MIPDFCCAPSKCDVCHGKGGWHANFHVSATEWDDPEFHDLIKLGFLEYWSTVGGFPAFRTTKAGKEALDE